MVLYATCFYSDIIEEPPATTAAAFHILKEGDMMTTTMQILTSVNDHSMKIVLLANEVTQHLF